MIKIPIQRLMFSLFLLCFALPGFTLPAFAQVRPVQEIDIRILPETEVFGAEFTLGEIAEMDSFDLEALKKLSQVRIGTSPLPGRSIRLSESLIRSRLAAARANPKLKLHVPRGARVVRAGQIVSGKEIAQIVLAQAEKDAKPGGKDELRQEIVRMPADVVLPKGRLGWLVKLIGNHLVSGGARIYSVQALVDGSVVWKSTVRVRQKIYREVVVAKRPIRRNHKINRADVQMVRKNISANRADPYLISFSQVVGRLTKRPVGKDESLHAGMLHKPADVPEGGRVTVVYQSGTLHLTVPGVAMVQGRAGQFIPVRNLETGRIVHGILQADETVRVN
jgi:flagella basal body P-ring formation protein FlgA